MGKTPTKPFVLFVFAYHSVFDVVRNQALPRRDINLLQTTLRLGVLSLRVDVLFLALDPGGVPAYCEAQASSGTWPPVSPMSVKVLFKNLLPRQSTSGDSLGWNGLGPRQTSGFRVEGRSTTSGLDRQPYLPNPKPM